MEILCTRPGCPRPLNTFSDLDNPTTLKTVQQKFCTTCGMPLILVGRYLPSRLLGRGGFGAAFLAQDRYTPTLRRCVVKQFQPAGNLNAQTLAIAQELFEREAMVLEKLGSKHPQIPDLYAFFPLVISNAAGEQEAQFFYLVQELIDGQNLEEELASKGVFSEAQVREVLTEILKVLQFVHDRGSIHRDIKPSNIMRDQEGQLYLLDFGAVKQIAAGAGNVQGRSTGIYSMGFAPPEQMQGSQVYPSTDLYALAATCLNLLTGKPLEELYDSYHNVWNWRTHAPQVSDRLAATLDRLLLPTPKDRFGSASEVLQALNSVAQPSTTTLQPPSPSAPSTPVPSPAAVVQPKRARASFSLGQMLLSAGGTGFEGALLIVGLKSLLAAPGIIVGCMIIAALIYLQSRRIIEGKDLPIVAVITLALMFFVPVLRGGLAFPMVAVVALLAGAGAISIFALFRLIHLILSRFL